MPSTMMFIEWDHNLPLCYLMSHFPPCSDSYILCVVSDDFEWKHDKFKELEEQEPPSSTTK